MSQRFSGVTFAMPFSKTLRHGRPPRIRGWARARRGSSRPRRVYLRLCHHALTAHNEATTSSPTIWGLVLPGGIVHGYDRRRELRVKCNNGEKLVFTVKTDKEYNAWAESLEWGVREVERFWKIVHNRVLGEGGFAKVVFGFDLDSGDHAAVKVVEKAKCGKKELEYAEVEARVCAVVEHPALVPILDIFDDLDSMHIVMQYMDGGTLEQCMNSRPVRSIQRRSADGPMTVVRPSPFSEDDTRTVMLRVLSALLYLHGANIAHRDLKPENVLLEDVPSSAWPSTVRLSDFGLAAFMDDDRDKLLSEVVGTPEYLAPEIISRNENNERPGYGTPVDIWAAGVLMYWMLGGCLPFDGPDNGAVFRMIRNENPDMKSDSCWQDVSEDAKSLVSSLLNKDPGKRISALGALAHPWFQLTDRQPRPRGPRGALHGRLRNYRSVWRVIIHVVIAFRALHFREKKRAKLMFSDFNRVEVLVESRPRDRAPEMAPTGLPGGGLGWNVGFIPSIRSPRRRPRTGSVIGLRQARGSDELSRKLTGSSSFGSTLSQNNLFSKPFRGRERELDQRPEKATNRENDLPHAPDGVSPIAFHVGILPTKWRKPTKPEKRSRFTKATPA